MWQSMDGYRINFDNETLNSKRPIVYKNVDSVQAHFSWIVSAEIVAICVNLTNSQLS